MRESEDLRRQIDNAVRLLSLCSLFSKSGMGRLGRWGEKRTVVLCESHFLELSVLALQRSIPCLRSAEHQQIPHFLMWASPCRRSM